MCIASNGLRSYLAGHSYTCYNYEFEKMEIGELVDGYFIGKLGLLEISKVDKYSESEMSYIVESVFMRCIPKPIVLLESENDITYIIDGIKKIVACNAFINGELMLDGLKILSRFNGKKFDDLSDDEKTYFKGFEIYVEKINKYNEKDIIERIKTRYLTIRKGYNDEIDTAT